MPTHERKVWCFLASNGIWHATSRGKKPVDGINTAACWSLMHSFGTSVRVPVCIQCQKRVARRVAGR